MALYAWTAVGKDKPARVFNYAVSDRVGNVQVHPHWGLLPGCLWID